MDVEGDHGICVRALEAAGLLVPLAEGTGVVGFDGMGYPAPTLDQVLDRLERNADLVERKAAQGFTRLLLTPLAAPVGALADGVSAAVRAREGSLLRTRAAPGDPGVPAGLTRKGPVWVWERLRAALDTPRVVYLPASYGEDHGGVTKDRLVRDPRRCAVPGWSVGLVEDLPVIPGQGTGVVVGGRPQLEAGLPPRDYLAALAAPAHAGETGYTLEDALVHLLSRLEATGEVSHDRSDGSALWCLGSYLPALMERALVVPTVAWQSGRGRRLYIGAHRTANRAPFIGPRTVVRLPG